MSLYSMLSRSAMSEASMTLVDTPTVVQEASPSVERISTRTLAPVASLLSMTRTL